MLIKFFETSKIDIKHNSFILLHGNNEALKDQTKTNLLKKDNISHNYYENEVINNYKNFFESISSKSLFENEKIIIINHVTDKIFQIVSEIIDKKFKNLVVILDANNLEKKSKLRSLFEKSKDLVCVPFYPDTDETLRNLTMVYLKNKNISISSSSVNLILDRCKGDRKILFGELEKITNYLKKGKKINTEAVAKLTNLIENHSISKLIDNCLAKNEKKTVNILVENNFSSDDCIVIIRIFINKLKKILKLSKEFQINNDIDITISTAKPPIFWKEKEITKQQVINWTPNAIKEILY
uniref:DNA polymerase III subunit delta n=1 Tax=Candidatus Pelagibacter sp. HIMB1715 TaxID=3413369 RepID=UPI003F866ACC